MNYDFIATLIINGVNPKIVIENAISDCGVGLYYYNVFLQQAGRDVEYALIEKARTEIFDIRTIVFKDGLQEKHVSALKNIYDNLDVQYKLIVQAVEKDFLRDALNNILGTIHAFTDIVSKKLIPKEQNINCRTCENLCIVIDTRDFKYRLECRVNTPCIDGNQYKQNSVIKLYNYTKG